MFGSRRSRDMSKYCHFHEDYGHDTNERRQLRNQIEEAVKYGQLSHLVKGIKKQKSIQGRFEGPLNQIFRRKVLVYWEISLEITIGDPPLTRKETLNFMIVKSNSPYNMLLGRTTMQKMEIMVSTIHKATKFHTTRGIGMVFSTHESDKVREGMKKTYANLIRIPRIITVKGKSFNTKQKLNEYSHVKPIKQKRRGLGPDRNTAACKEVEELTKAGILQEVKRQTWVANPVMMPFRLKNAGATYQRLVDKVFHDQIGRNLKEYVNDMVIKSTSKEEMLADIKETFEKFRSINMKLNPKKSITDVELPKTLNDIQSLNEKITPSTVFNQRVPKDHFPSSSTSTRGDSDVVPRSLDREHNCDFVRKKGRRTSPYLLCDKTVKDFLIKVPLEDNEKKAEEKADPKLIKMELSCEWKLFTDGAASSDGSSAGLMLIDPDGKEYTLIVTASPQTDDIVKEVLQDCKKCKEQSAIWRVAESSAISTRSGWPFSHWGINILGLLPTTLEGFKFLAIAIEHSTKWVEAKPLLVINGRHAERMLPRNSQKETLFSLTYGIEAIIPIPKNDVSKDDRGRIKEVDKRRGNKKMASIEEAYYRRGTQVWQGPHMISEVHGGGLYKITDASDHSLTKTAKSTNLCQRFKATHEPSLNKAHKAVRLKVLQIFKYDRRLCSPWKPTSKHGI
ncbi:hypothetical protein Tco_0394399 [Tanacetum coccineum]